MSRVSRVVPGFPGLYETVGARSTSYHTVIQNQRHPLGKNLDDAKRKLQQLLELPVTVATVEAMCEAYLAEQWALIRARDPVALAEITVSDYEQCLRKGIYPVFGSMRPDDIKPADCARFLMEMRKLGKSVRANRHLAALSSAYNYGMACGFAQSNPCRGVRRNKERPRNRKVAVAELNAFLAHAKAKGGSAYLVALIGCCVALSGRRRKEVLHVRRNDITPEGFRVTESKIKPGETPRHYLIEWSPTMRMLVNEVDSIKRNVKSLYLFATLDGQPYEDSGFKTLWNRLMHSYAPGGADSPEWFRAHDLRALYVSEMLEQGRDPNTHRNEQTMRTVYDRRKVIKVSPLA